MSILENIARIETAKEEIKNALIEKGVKVSDEDKLDSYAIKIMGIKGDDSNNNYGITKKRFVDQYIDYTNIISISIQEGVYELIEDA